MEAVNQTEAFAPIEVKPNDDRSSHQSNPPADFEPIPITRDTIAPPSSHPKLGKPSARWPYPDAEGRLEGFMCRFDTRMGKRILPLRYGRVGDDERWHWKGWGNDRPLYQLPKLVESPKAPVLIVEGEKSADAAAQLFPDLIVTTTMNGSRSQQKTDFSPLAGRDITIWPDNDQPGRDYADRVAELALNAGATSVRVVDVPAAFPAKWDLADTLPEEVTFEDLQKLLQNARAHKQAYEQQGEFVCVREAGIYAPGVYIEAEDIVENKHLQRLCSPLEVVALTRDEAGESWGRLLQLTDRDGVTKRWAMPMSMLARDGGDYRERLLSMGLEIAPSARSNLHKYIQTWEVEARVRCVDRTGWHHGAFVFPDDVIGTVDGEEIVLQSSGASPAYDLAGSLEGWQDEVARYAIGNSRFALGIMIGLAGPLLNVLNEENGGFHFVGGSSIGKTTALHAAASVWGCAVHTWRTTDNAAETLASGANDALLCLDELSQVDGKAADTLAYMIGNGTGKARMRRDASARATKRWRVILASTGEIGLAEKMNEINRNARAGQEVRLVEIPADAGAGYGLFEELHGFSGGDQLSRHVKHVAARNKGHASRAFLEILTSDPDAAEAVAALKQQWVDQHCPRNADGQVMRVAARFGLLAAAGELAIDTKILPWPEGEAEDAAKRCFNAWLLARGGCGASEIREGLRQVKLFLEQHGASRFELVNNSRDDQRVVNNRAGFRRYDGVDHDGWDDDPRTATYLVFPEVWRAEVCKGFNHLEMAREMAARDWLKADSNGRLDTKVRVPGHAENGRYYVIKPRFLEEHGAS